MLRVPLRPLCATLLALALAGTAAAERVVVPADEGEAAEWTRTC